MGINWILVGVVTAGGVAAVLIGVAFLLFEVPRSKRSAGTPGRPEASGP